MMLRTIPEIEFNKCIPEDIDKVDYLDISQRNLIVLDDLMAQSSEDKRIADLFTKGSHHRNLSIIYIVQNKFHQGKEMRNISLNAHYIVLFKSPRDKQQIYMLARQINPGRVQEFMRSYEDATSRPYGYLMLDFKAYTCVINNPFLACNSLTRSLMTLAEAIFERFYECNQQLSTLSPR